MALPVHSKEIVDNTKNHLELARSLASSARIEERNGILASLEKLDQNDDEDPRIEKVYFSDWIGLFDVVCTKTLLVVTLRHDEWSKTKGYLSFEIKSRTEIKVVVTSKAIGFITEEDVELAMKLGVPILAIARYIGVAPEQLLASEPKLLDPYLAFMKKIKR